MLKINEHEDNLTKLTELIKAETLDVGQVSTIIQALRDNYSDVDKTTSTMSKEFEKVSKLNESLLYSNSDLLSKLSIQTLTPPTKEDKKGTQQQQENVVSDDELFKSFI